MKTTWKALPRVKVRFPKGQHVRYKGWKIGNDKTGNPIVLYEREKFIVKGHLDQGVNRVNGRRLVRLIILSEARPKVLLRVLPEDVIRLVSR